MNYAGKFDAALSLDGQGSHSPAHPHVDSHFDSFTAKGHGHVPAGAFVVPDPNLLFHGHFDRVGVDLVLTRDGEEFVVHDYFKGEKRAAIASPDGAHLTGDIVDALTGHVEMAQAAPGAAGAAVIGHVTKLTGSATIVRNGVSIILNNGDNVEKGDVVSTGSDSTLGITFIDGTVFGLSANARMVLNEMVYDPNGSSNSSLLSLVAGTITFVAGETAKHGDMKIDTPVATMGIRGTAVLTEINFVIPSGGGDPQPQANFQVLVEPDGRTGSYILYDKTTLLPLATVNQAGQMIQISGGNVTVTNALLSPEVQKLISEVFTLKFTDNSSNTKLTTNFTDTITPDINGFVIKTASGITAQVTSPHTNTESNSDPEKTSTGPTRAPGPPHLTTTDLHGNPTTQFAITERAGQTNDTTDFDVTGGTIIFSDLNLGDRPTVTMSLAGAPNYVYQNANHLDVTASLTALQKADIAATQIRIALVPDANNANNGSVGWTYSVPDHAFDFLAAGETLTLTYNVRVDDNFGPNDEFTIIPITIRITGTNDVPVITSAVPTITFAGGTSVPGGPLTSTVATSGTLTFTDVDLTDTHTVRVALTNASLPGGTVPPGPLAVFERAMAVVIANNQDSTGTGNGTINWSLADLPVYLADFIPRGETLTLTYTVTLTDSQSATATQTITVTIKGTDRPAVVWIATSGTGGFWKDAANWETGTVPTINDDVIIITDQLHGLTPSYPVTIDQAAFANSVTMNDFGGPPPKLDNKSSLTIANTLKLSADSILHNFLGATITVGGAATIEGTASLNNAGLLTLSGGGTITTATSLVNTGTIDLAGGTLRLSADITNSGGIFQVDAGTTLDVSAATIDGGTLTVAGTLVLEDASVLKNGELHNSGAVAVIGAVAFDNETVTNHKTIEIHTALTLAQATTIDNSSGTITIDDKGLLVLDGAEISGGTINDFSGALGGLIDVTGDSSIDGGATLNKGALTVEGDVTLTLDDMTVSGTKVTDKGTIDLDGTVKLQGGATIQGASVAAKGAVTNNGTLEIAGPATLLNDTVTNNGTVTVDASQTLTLSGTEIKGGAINGAGTIDVTIASTIDNNATLSTSFVTADAKLTLDNVTVSGTVITDNAGVELDDTVKLKGSAEIKGGAVTNTGTLEVTGPATLLNDVVTNTGTVTVDASQTLTLEGTEIKGGTINGAGTIDVTAASTIDNNATLSTSFVTADAKLTLDNVTVSGTVVTDNAGLELDDTVKLKGSAEIKGGAVTNNGTLEVTGPATLLNDVVTNTGTVTIDASQTLTLSGTEIKGGAISGAGTIDVTAASTIDNNATLSTSFITADAKLTLDNVTVSGTVITDNAGLELDDTVKLKGSAEIKGGAVTNNGTLEIAGPATLLNDVVTNTGTVTVDASQTLTLSGTEIKGGIINGAGTIDVTIASTIDNNATLSTSFVTADAKLTLDNVTVSGTVITDNVGVELDDTVKLKGSAEIKGGAVINNGTLEVTGPATLLNDVVTNTGTVTVDASQTLTLEGTEIKGGTINGAGTIDVTDDSTIDNNATLSTDFVTVESGKTLKLDDATVSGTAVTVNGTGTVEVDATRKLTLNGAGITGGKLNVSGTLDSTGKTTVTNTDITNNFLIEAIGGVLTLAGTSSFAIANDGTIQANGGELDINGEPVTNHDTLAAINDGTLKLISTKVSNAIGAGVSVDATSTLDLVDATIQGGTVTISGTLESTGLSAIDQANIVNTGTIDVTSGTLTIDPIVLRTLTNHSLIEANGGVLDISGERIVNTKTLEAVNGGTLKLTNVVVTNTGGAVTIDGSSKLYLAKVSINDGTLDNAGHLYSVSDLNTVTAAVTNTGTIEVQDDTLDLAGGLTGAGTLIIDDGATLELAGADAQTVTFAGGTDTLQLDNVAGQSFTGTIAGQATTGGTFNVTGAGNITTASGDALDFTSTGGTADAPADIVLTPTGTLSGAANGLVVTQNGTGQISLTATGNITGHTGNGIALINNSAGSGDITVNDLTGIATGTGAGSVGLLAEILNAANDGDISVTQLGGASGGAFGIDATTYGDGEVTVDAGGHITGGTVYGIRARSYGTGSETVTTEAGSVITSGSSGIVAVNRAIALDGSNQSTITVNAYGTINSGASPNQSGNAPAGIQAGYAGATTGTAANTAVNGTVIVNNHADITAAAGYGIDAYNYGNGDVTVNNAAGTTISVSGPQSIGIAAFALSGGTGNVTVALAANVSVTGATSYGIEAYSIDAGNISVTTADGDNISSGSTGILAVNHGTNIPVAAHSSIHVNAHGTIHSGVTSNLGGSTPGAIIAGYNPGGNGLFSSKVHGDVIVESDATIIADAGFGIEAFTWGVGNVTVTTGAHSDITAAGTAIGAFDHGGGDVSVTNEGSATGAVGLSALATGAGNVTIVNDGDLTGTATVGIVVTQNANGATGSTHITNTDSVAGATGHAAIFIQENTTGTALIDNSGTIGPAVAGTVTSTTYAIVETGGHITINNTGEINGNIQVASATFNNELGGTWTVSGTSVFGSLSSIANAGKIDLHDGASISGTGLGITNTGEIDSWGATSISGTITNNQAIIVDSGTLTLFGSLSGSGSVAIDAGATLKLDGTVAQTVTFSGADAELKIDTTSFGGSIAGLAATDKIDLSSINYGLGTHASFVSNGDHTGGVLTVTDAGGDSISMTLVGDYSNATFAGTDDGSGHTLITMKAADDAPHFTAAETSQSVNITELAGVTGSSAADPSPAATGTIHFTDVDLTDRPTASVTSQTLTWTGADHSTNLTGLLTLDQIHTIEHALSLQQSGNYNNGAVGWTYSIPDSTLDFLGKGETLTLVSTITLSDGRGGTDIAHVTVNFTGTNDAPTLDGATLATVSGGNTDPTGTSVADLFAGKFHDVDHGARFTAIAVTADNATADQGHWQYEIPGTGQWVDIGSVSDGHALVLSTDTLLRFVPTNGFSGAPGTLDVHALDDTYNGTVTTTSPVTIDITNAGIGHGGSTPVSDHAASIGVDVTPASPPSNVNTWTGDAGDGEWTTGGNWDLGHVPTATETAVIAASTVDFALDANGSTVGGLTIASDAELDLVGTGYNPDSHGVDSYLLVDGELANSSLIDVRGAILDEFHHVTNSGTIKADGQNAILNFGNLPGSTIDNAGGTLAAVDGGEIDLAYNTVNGGEIDATGYGSVVHLIDAILNGTYLVGDDQSTFEVGSGTTTFNGTEATMVVDAKLHIDLGGKLVLDGTVTDSHGLYDGGTVVVESGTTQILGDLSGGGNVQIMAAHLELGGASGNAVQFVGTGIGTLLLDSTSHFTGTVTGFSYGDTIDLAGIDQSKITFTHSGGGLQVHYGTGDSDYFTITGNYDESGFTETSDSHGGTNLVWNHQAPVIDTTHFVHTHNADNTDTVTGLTVTGSPTETYTLSAVTDGASDGTYVVPASLNGLTLDQVQTDIANVTYHPGGTPPVTDRIAFTVTDSFGTSDTVNFIFNEGGTGPVTLTGTSGRDVIFASNNSDTLAGNGGQDQFVFGAAPEAVHTILDFDTTQDKIDLRQFGDINSFGDIAFSQHLNDTLITLDDHETIVLKNVLAANLRASDFIVTNHSGGTI